MSALNTTEFIAMKHYRLSDLPPLFDLQIWIENLSKVSFEYRKLFKLTRPSVASVHHYQIPERNVYSFFVAHIKWDIIQTLLILTVMASL